MYNLFRNCCDCKEKITYSNKQNYIYSLKHNKEVRCSKCRGKALSKKMFGRGPTRGKHLSEETKKKISASRIGKHHSDESKKKMSTTRTGEGNPFFGKHHSDKTKEILKNVDRSIWKTDEFRKKMSSITSGENNGMFGKHIFDIWVEKYGQDEALKRYKAWKKSLSKANSGEKNPMFGKPAPLGSGNGIGGWYVDIHFRSLRELNYILYLEKQNIKWENGELKEFNIEFTDTDGTKRTYRPDFILTEEKCMIECKPEKLFDTDINKLKREAGIKFCEEMGFLYIMLDPGVVDLDVLKELVLQKRVKLIRNLKEFENMKEEIDA